MWNRYDGPIIDPHHHLWDLSLKRHPWLAPDKGHAVGNIDAIKRDYLVEDYLADSRRQNVVATVHVEASWTDDDCLGETRWLETLDRRCGVAARLVAHVPLASPRAAALLDAQAAFDRVVGIRDIVSWHEDPAKRFVARRDMMDDPAWRAGLSGLAAHGLSFDLMLLSRSDGGRAAAGARLSGPAFHPEPLRQPDRPRSGRDGHVADRPEAAWSRAECGDQDLRPRGLRP